MDNLLPIANGQAIARSDIPELDFMRFRETAIKLSRGSACLVQFFAYEDEQKKLQLLAVLRAEQQLYVVGCPLADEYPSLTCECEKFHLFEREIAEQFGVLPRKHPWLKMVRYHANWRDRPDIFGNNYSTPIPGNYPYFTVEGDAVHEVAVGPVHAGIIEPGHFRFQCVGEKVLHLEIQLGYQHRGAERLLQQQELSAQRLASIAESIAGDTAVGHSLCHAQAIEALAGIEVTDASRRIRSVALELERIANHVGDLGALSGDVAFSPPLNWFGRIRGEFLNLLLVLAGNRFGKGLIRPGGVAFPVTAEQRRIIREKISAEKSGIANVCDLLFSAHTMLARFEHTGTINSDLADRLGLVGVAGRASGIDYDVRVSFPTEAHHLLAPCANQRTVGDVYSRANVRREEIMHSLHSIVCLLDQKQDTLPVEAGESHALAPDSFVVTLNEAWRGEVSHCILTDSRGSILRYKIKDPSFHNWAGLAMAMRDQGISDFPLCNKSFNLSYCGFDL